jgi:hypothetical protein
MATSRTVTSGSIAEGAAAGVADERADSAGAAISPRLLLERVQVQNWIFFLRMWTDSRSPIPT